MSTSTSSVTTVSRDRSPAERFALVSAAVYLGAGVVGLLAAFVLGVAGGGDFLNITSVGEPDNWLHLAWGAASLAFGRAAAGRVPLNPPALRSERA